MKEINQGKKQQGVRRTKKSYKKPELIPLGDIRDVTMGGSPGFGDSGAGLPEKPF
jgi:hypothetical protein